MCLFFKIEEMDNFMTSECFIFCIGFVNSTISFLECKRPCNDLAQHISINYKFKTTFYRFFRNHHRNAYDDCTTIRHFVKTFLSENTFVSSVFYENIYNGNNGYKLSKNANIYLCQLEYEINKDLKIRSVINYIINCCICFIIVYKTIYHKKNTF